ncbi:MAG: UvrD-helicase domain-containing protein [Planctomycetia bacterium]|nr:UvrD-helicase domain-containing protein [Planctomycetia bacterium]
MERNLLIRASAGSGKTYQLSRRFLHLAKEGASVSSILASTFTRKAAGEIQNRVLLQAAQDCLAEEDPLLREKKLVLLKKLVANLHRMRIFTLDSYFKRIAECFSYEIGLMPGWSIIDDAEDESLRWRAIRTTLRQDPRAAREIMRRVSPGESVRNFASSIFDTVRSQYALVQSSSNSAWNAMKSLPLDGWMAEDTLAHTIEEIRTIAENFPEGTDKRLSKAVAGVIEKASVKNWMDFLKSTLVKNAASNPYDSVRFYGKPVPEGLERPLRRLIRHAIGAYLKDVQEQTSATYDIVSIFGRNYEDLKIQQKAFRFEDVTRHVARFAQERQNLHAFDWRLDASTEHLLLDEFQDTSLDQWSILEPVGRYCTTHKGSSFFCVGDVKQAIYRWRNGRAEIFDSVASAYPNMTIESSNRSWRSSPTIIECVNRVFGDDPFPPPIRSGSDSIPMSEVLEENAACWSRWHYEKHETARDYPGYWEIFTSPSAESDSDSDSDSESGAGGEGDGSTNKPKQKDVTLRCAAEKIRDLYATTGNHTIGVLTRGNDSLQKLIFYLRRLNVPASEDGKNPLINSSAVRLILSLFKFLEHPGDSVSWFHLAHSALGQFYPEFEWVPIWAPKELQESAQALRMERAEALRREIATFGFSAIIEKIVERWKPSLPPEELRRLQQFIKLAGTYDTKNTSNRIADFVRFVEITRVADPSSARVSVMTIHMSKGLQFDTVVLPDLHFKLTGTPPQFAPGYPNNDVMKEIHLVAKYVPKELRSFVLGVDSPFSAAIEHYESQVAAETLCLLYVAMTRAVHALYLVIPPAMSKSAKVPSKYVDQILLRTLAGETNAPPSSLIAWDGDPRWYEKTGKSSTLAHSELLPRVVSPAVFEPRPAFLRKDGSYRNLPRRSPSNVEDPLRVDLGRMLGFRHSSTVSGVIWHRWYEKITWVETSLPSAEELRSVALQYDLPQQTLERLLRNFHNSLKNSAVQSILYWHEYIPAMRERVAASGILPIESIPSGIVCDDPLDKNKLRWEIHCEKELAIRTEREFFLGAMDRLVVLKDLNQVYWADCIDFKTLKKYRSDEFFEEQVRRNARQMQDYRTMLSVHYRIPIEQISARILFTMLGIVREIH